MMANQTNKVLYTGVTNDLQRRVYEHRNHVVKGFTQKYHVEKLVFYQTFPDVRDALAAEKQIKSWTRTKKNQLVSSMNPMWRDLAPADASPPRAF